MKPNNTPRAVAQRPLEAPRPRFASGGPLVGRGLAAFAADVMEIVVQEIEAGRQKEAVKILRGLAEDWADAGRDEQAMAYALDDLPRLSQADEYLNLRRAGVFARHFPEGRLDNVGRFICDEPFLRVGPSDAWVSAFPGEPQIIVAGRGLLELVAFTKQRDIAGLLKELAPKLVGAQ